MRDMLWAYRLRWKRRELLFRAVLARKQLLPLRLTVSQLAPSDVLAFLVVRNEGTRLPFFLAHHRALGVAHFFVVDNGSTDGTAAYLREQDDVSVWSTQASYRSSRFGMDWLTWLMIKFGHGHWCLTVDADELLTYPHHTTRSLIELTAALDAQQQRAMAAPMIELYPKGPINLRSYKAGQDPLDVLTHFDARNYWTTVQEKLWTQRLQGGVRQRVFFPDRPDLSPTLNKTPLVKWSRRYVYNNSTHTLLPRSLNKMADDPSAVRGALLHTKFLPDSAARAAEERLRKEHFRHPEDYEEYYASLEAGPDLWDENSVKFEGWEQLRTLGFMSDGGWT